MPQQKYSYGMDFQKSILNLMIQDKTFLETYPDVIHPRFFTLDVHMAIAQIVTNYWKKHREVPQESTIQVECGDYFVTYNTSEAKRQNILDVLDEIYHTQIQNRAAITDRVCHFARTQSVKDGIREVLDLIDQGDDLNNTLDIMRQSLAVGAPQAEYWSLFPEMRRFQQRLKEDQGYNYKNKIQTLLPKLDRATFGGIGAGQLWVIGAKPKGGKSTLLCNFGAAALLQSKIVIHFSFGDMNRFDVLLKYAQRLTGMTVESILANPTQVESSILRMQKPGAAMYIQYESPGVMGVPELYAQLSLMRATSGVDPDLVIVDYANKMKMDDYNNTYRSMGRIYEGLKELGDAFDCGVLTGVQLKRDADRDKGTPEGVADSWQQVADCDLMLFINQSEADEGQGRAVLSVPIIRRGGSTSIPVLFNKTIARFKEL